MHGYVSVSILVNITNFYTIRQIPYFFVYGVFHNKEKKAQIKGLDKPFFAWGCKYFKKIQKRD